MSAQQDHYLRLRAEGMAVEAAEFEADIVPGEGKLIDAALARGELEIPAAGEAAPPEERFMPSHDTIEEELPEDHHPIVELAAETLRGDIRDSLLDWFKAQPKSWPFMSETEQRSLADSVDAYSYTLIKEACRIIAAGERPTIVAKLVEYREKDGVEAKLKLPSTAEVVGQLHEACGRFVLVVATGAEEYEGEKAPPAVDPDQTKLRGIGDEYDEGA